MTGSPPPAGHGPGPGEALIDHLRQALPPVPLGLAVSGGGDSMALLHLCAAAGLRPRVATVNHGLRPEAAEEAAVVARTCAKLGLSHDTLHWTWDGRGNLQDAARRGRRDLLAAWAAPQGLAVVLAHSRDDIAETFLMRLARGAGVDGLSAMAPGFAHHGVTFLRPLLQVSRLDLRRALQALGATWVEDPSNHNPRFDRARLRASLPDLARIGLTTEAMARSAGALLEARAALEALADLWLPRVLTQDRGTLLIHPALHEAPAETQRRLLARALLWLAPAPYPPRGAALSRLLQRLPQAATLAGVRFHPTAQGLRAYREARSLPPPVPADQVWDGRWRAKAPPGAMIGPLGAQAPKSDLPRAALAALPAIWLDQRPVAAPFAGIFHEEIQLYPLLPDIAPLTGALSH